MVYAIQVCWQLASRIRMEPVPSWSCSHAVSKPVWLIPLLCVQWKTPNDGQRNCPKCVEFYSKNKLDKLVHLVGFIVRIYHNARSSECQIRNLTYWTSLEIVMALHDDDIKWHWNPYFSLCYKIGICLYTLPLNHIQTPVILWICLWISWRRLRSVLGLQHYVCITDFKSFIHPSPVFILTC